MNDKYEQHADIGDTPVLNSYPIYANYIYKLQWHVVMA